MPNVLVIALLLPGLADDPSAAAEAVALRDDADSTSSWRTTVEVAGEGTFEFQPPGDADKPVTHPVSMTATLKFVERRLPSAGRDEAAFRSLRRFEEARSEIRVGSQTSHPHLRSERSRIVARATRQGVTAYSPDGPLTSREIDLLPLAADPLLLSAMLPGRDMAVGETWNPDGWIAQAMAGAEIALKSSLSCRLESVRNGRASISLKGDVDGATKGATSKTALSGTLTYDLAAAAVVAAELTQSETRSIGPLSPGMTFTVKTSLRRSPTPRELTIADADAGDVPLDPPSEALWIEHEAPFGVLLAGDREWRVFHQTPRLLILRLLDRGGLVAQCNVAPAPKVKPGEHTPDRQFQEDIRRSLGEQLSEISSAEEVQAGSGLRVYSVSAKGAAGGAERMWRYYLATAPDGRQASFVFTIEPATLRRLGRRDIELVLSTTFLDEGSPTPAAASAAGPSSSKPR